MKFNLYHPSESKEELMALGRGNFEFLQNEGHKQCLPLKIAGELGWDLILPNDYIINWNGGLGSHDIRVISEDKSDFITTRLGSGLVSFKIPYLFELEAGNFLWIKGSNNNPLSLDLYPCEGLVECDWFPGNMTMNYKITTVNKDIVLKKGSPYCRLLPYPKKYIETFEPVYKTFNDDPIFYKKYMTYSFYNRCMIFAKNFLTSYVKGMVGTKKMDNVLKIKLSNPKKISDIPSKCPFSKLIKK